MQFAMCLLVWKWNCSLSLRHLIRSMSFVSIDLAWPCNPSGYLCGGHRHFPGLPAKSAFVISAIIQLHLSPILFKTKVTLV